MEEIYNNLLKKVNENKHIIIGLVILLVFYISYLSYLSDDLINIFNHPIIKLIIFGLIFYISIDNLVVGIILTIIILVSVQVISNVKIKNEINSELKLENFYSVNGFDQTDNYKSNPLLKLNQLSTITNNLNLEYETPEQFYKNMINDGKNLLNNTYGMQKDLKKRYDSREDEIIKSSNHHANMLIQSGINRLQQANQGEYNMPSYSNNKLEKYIKYNNIEDNYLNNSEIIELFDKLKNNYKKLENPVLNQVQFEEQLNEYYENKLDLIEKIFEYKKDSLDKDKVNQINEILDDIKQNKKDKNNNWMESIDVLIKLLF